MRRALRPRTHEKEVDLVEPAHDLNPIVLHRKSDADTWKKHGILRKDEVMQTIDLPYLDALKESHDASCCLGIKLREDEQNTTFYCCGRIPREGSYRKRHGMCETGIQHLRSDSSISSAVEALGDQDLSLTCTLDPAVPFVEDLPEELLQGRSIEIYGKLLENANRFSINLSTGQNNESDLALHFNPRFDRHIVIRNHRIRGKWGVEEITSLQQFPFKSKRNFSVLIFVADEQFLIAVNKVHYCAFVFRIPVEKIKSLIILGDISLAMVQHSDQAVYPPQILKKTPFIIIPHSIKYQNKKCCFRRKVKEIKTGTCIEIFGRLKILPRAFYVNIQKGITVWPHPIIPFHMNYRLHLPGSHKTEKEVIFNSWLDGLWGKEEVITRCPFLPGSNFHLKIICESNAYNVMVDDRVLYMYEKRSEMDVDSVVIHGDVVVDKVLLH